MKAKGNKAPKVRYTLYVSPDVVKAVDKAEPEKSLPKIAEELLEKKYLPKTD